MVETGYKAGVTQDWGINQILLDPFALRRIEIPYYENLEVFSCRVSRILRPFSRKVSAKELPTAVKGLKTH